MQNIFSFKRFWLLVYKHWNEFRTKLLISIIVMLIAAIFGTIILTFRNQDLMFNIFSNFLVLFGGIYTAMFFKDWSYKARSVSFVVLPASALEKILLVLFYAVVVFVPLFTLIYFGHLYGLSKILHQDKLFLILEQYRGLSPLPAILIYAVLPYMFFQSIVLLFSVWFKKNQFMIAFVLFALLMLGVGIWNAYFIRSLISVGDGLPTVSKQLVFFPLDVSYWDSDSKIRTMLITKNIVVLQISVIVLTISTLLFYLASYFKLKEKEV